MIDTTTASVNDQRGQRPSASAASVPTTSVASDSHEMPVRPERLAVEGAVDVATSRYSRNEPNPAPTTVTRRIAPIVTAAPATARQRRLPTSQPPRLAGDSFVTAISPTATPASSRSRSFQARTIKPGKNAATLPAASCSPIAGARIVATSAPGRPVRYTR